MDSLQNFVDHYVQLVLGFFELHPMMALVIIFLIAFGEALLIIGLFVPSTAVLIGAGTLVGAGKLEFWPVMAATIIGCILGDQISYWAGRMYGEKLKTMWPLRNFPHLLAKGEDYVREHGGKSIAIGRFIPGIKAVIPGIAGMFGMSQTYFTVVNIISGTAWGLLHVLPGVLLGKALAFAGELSGRLVLVLLVLLALLAIVGWLMRIFAASLSPYRNALQGRISAYAATRKSKFVRRMGRAIAPENPRSALLVMFMVIGIAALVFLVDLVSGLYLRQAVGNFDHSIFNLFSELRSAPGDELFVRLTMLGDEWVLFAVAAVPALWFALLRKWHTALAIIVTVFATKLLTVGFSFLPHMPFAGAHAFDFQFPSPHTLLAGTVFGILTVLASRGLQRWSLAVVAAMSSMIVLAIAFSRIYLGVNWLSDVVGGGLIAAILTVIFSVLIAPLPMHRFRPTLMLSVAMVVFLIAGALNVSSNYEHRADRYQPLNKVATMDLTHYLQSGWQQVPGKRINLVGNPADAFVLQWVGTAADLETVLARHGLTPQERWSWRDAMIYLNPHVDFKNMAPNPAVHEGLRAKVTATMTDASHEDARLVLRAYQSNTVVGVEGKTASRVFLISYGHERPKRTFGLYAVPVSGAVEADELAKLMQKLQSDPLLEFVPVNGGTVAPMAILKLKS